jgi:hypothetical protein
VLAQPGRTEERMRWMGVGQIRFVRAKLSQPIG